MKKLSIIAALLIFISSIISPAAMASDIAAEAYDGYIIKIRDGVVLPENNGLYVLGGGLYSTDDRNAVGELIDLGIVEFVERDCSVELLESEIPNDEFYSMQWNIEKINALSAAQIGVLGEGVRIAVIDSGINAGHLDLDSKTVVQGLDVTNGSTDTKDMLGHGTAVAGVIAAQSFNSIGIVGIVPDVTLVPLKCFKTSTITNVTYIVSAIYKAIDDFNCDIINLSLGVDTDVKALRQAVEYAENKGVIVISSVGNSGTEKYYFPASYPTVVGVGSIGNDGSISYFSQRNDSVFVLAPGEEIVSISNRAPDGYVSCSGTSYATPHVSAAAAAAKCFDPDMTPEDFRKILQITSSNGRDGYVRDQGYGVIDMAEMLAEQQRLYEPPDPYPDIFDHWARESIIECFNNGLLYVEQSAEFKPEKHITRAEFLYMLAALTGTDMTAYSSEFTDVAPDSWHYPAVSWAAEAGIVIGNGDGTFSPEDEITREQMAALLHRYALWCGIELTAFDDEIFSAFTDSGEMSDWAREPFGCAVAADIIHGTSLTTLEPFGWATRGEAATLMINYMTSVLGIYGQDDAEPAADNADIIDNHGALS